MAAWKNIFKKNWLFLLILFVFGVVCLLPYGAHLDQDSEQDILYSNAITFCERLNIMEPFCNELRQSGVVGIQESIEIDHGMSVFYLMTWIYWVNQKSPYVGNIIWHFYIYLICFVGTVCLFCLIKELFDRNTAVLITALYFFTPRLFAEMHYNNKDMVILSITCMVYYCGWRLLKDTSVQNAVFFGIVGGILTNMKIVGLFIWGGVGSFILVIKLSQKEIKKSWLWKAILCLVTASFLFYVITPAAWGNITGYFNYVIENAKNFRWNDYVLFSGKMYNKTATGFPRMYLPGMILATVPVGTLLLTAVGAVVMLLYIFARGEVVRKGYLCTLVVSGLFPLAYAVINATPVYNGWRHFYFSYAAIMIIASFAVDMLKRRFEERIVIFVGVVYILSLMIGIGRNHPYEYAYYNEIARYFVEDSYELDYWDMSFKQALEYIAQHDDRDSVFIAACDNPSKWGIDAQLSAIRGRQRGRFIVVDSWTDADYVLINRTYSFMYSDSIYQEIKEEYYLVNEIQSYGNTVCEIYGRILRSDANITDDVSLIRFQTVSFEIPPLWQTR